MVNTPLLYGKYLVESLLPGNPCDRTCCENDLCNQACPGELLVYKRDSSFFLVFTSSVPVRFRRNCLFVCLFVRLFVCLLYMNWYCLLVCLSVCVSVCPNSAGCLLYFFLSSLPLPLVQFIIMLAVAVLSVRPSGCLCVLEPCPTNNFIGQCTITIVLPCICIELSPHNHFSIMGDCPGHIFKSTKGIEMKLIL